MFSNTFLAATAGFSMLISSNAHMLITSPKPYGADTLNNSPLERDGSDFPCKQRGSGTYDITEMNNIAVGVPQSLEFEGTAVHGGGSCQVSVTLDEEPTKDSEWKVIHSIIGGCPATSAGNLQGDEKPSSFEFSMPQGMPNGQYTLAWTWFNKIGNREMYMNCAPIEVTGGADNNNVYNSLPDMFVANIPPEECSTTEMEDFVFPNPGDSVETAASNALGSATSGSCAGPTGGSGSGSGSGSGNDGSSGPAPTSAPSYDDGEADATSEAGPSLTLSHPQKGVDTPATTMATVTSEAQAQPSTTQAPSSYSAPEPSTPAQAPEEDNYDNGPSNGNDSIPAPPTDDSCEGDSVSCPTPGSLVCIGDNHWGKCDLNHCAVPMPLAAGTACQDGNINAVEKRSNAHLHRHLHKRSI